MTREQRLRLTGYVLVGACQATLTLGAVWWAMHWDQLFVLSAAWWVCFCYALQANVDRIIRRRLGEKFRGPWSSLVVAGMVFYGYMSPLPAWLLFPGRMHSAQATMLAAVLVLVPFQAHGVYTVSRIAAAGRDESGGSPDRAEESPESE